MNDLETLLPAALNELGRHSPHQVDLADQARRGVRRARILTIGPIAAVLAVVLVLGSIWISRPGPSTPMASAPSACAPLLETAPPVWARAGFSGSSYPPFAYTASGNMVAIVFANPLVSPPEPGQNNKILWVTKKVPTGANDFFITGHLEGSDQTATIHLGASPGPSIVDMPAPGCWRLDLTWGTLKDSINLRWAAG